MVPKEPAHILELSPVGLDRKRFPALGLAVFGGELHEAGRVGPSLTDVGGHTVIRAALVNPRSLEEEVHFSVDEVLAAGRNAHLRQAA